MPAGNVRVDIPLTEETWPLDQDEKLQSKRLSVVSSPRSTVDIVSACGATPHPSRGTDESRRKGDNINIRSDAAIRTRSESRFR